ncbi:MAG TPA: leishmanolysin-related zinc metalloendopeptidase, partial [Gemmatimonadales bacterium]|nr:leishmanolysin-related zinc metalloendopeptidase [Gemmatimonadales bacterium]
ARWAAIITGDLADLTVTVGAGACGSNSPALASRPIDDLLIFATIEPIDGPGQILGSAGWCFIRTAGLLPIIGRMRFDIADIANLEASGRLTAVILHEMGHVLGIGTSWSLFGFLQSPSPVGGPPLDTHHNGANAIVGFNAVGGSTYAGGNKVPVENMFGSGTINAHWRESVLATELMTGFLGGGGSNPLSELTVRSLLDFGYVVDVSAADPFFLTLSLRGEGGGPPEVLIRLENDILIGPRYEIDANGRIRRIRD